MNKVGFYLLFSFSSNNVPAEEDQVGKESNSEMTLQDILRRQIIRPLCRFAGCGK